MNLTVTPGKTYRFVKRCKLPRYIVGTGGWNLGSSSSSKGAFPIKTQAMADAVLAWIRLYESKAPWELEEVK
jgi:hypothetical protein